MDGVPRGVVLLGWAIIICAWLVLGSHGCGEQPPCTGSCREATLERAPDAGGAEGARSDVVPSEPGVGPRLPAVPLLDHARWEPVPAAQDPFIDRKTDASKCGKGGWLLEAGSLEINTGICNFITLRQSSITEIRAGEVVQFAMLHQSLNAPSQGSAYVAITVDGQLIWEQTIPIPSSPKVYQPFWTPSGAIPKGAEIIFHLQNHGANTWNVHSLTTGAP